MNFKGNGAGLKRQTGSAFLSIIQKTALSNSVSAIMEAALLGFMPVKYLGVDLIVI